MLEQYNLRLEKKKTFIKTRLKNKSHTQGMCPTYEKETVQELIREYGYDLVVECMNELFLKEKKMNKEERVKFSTSNPLDFIKEINSFDKHGDIRNLFTKGYCYGFALMVKQAFKEGIIYWDKYNNHAIIKINNVYYDINGVYEPMNYSMLRKVDVTILEGSRRYMEEENEN